MSHCATEKAYLEEKKKAEKWNSQYDPSLGEKNKV